MLKRTLLSLLLALPLALSAADLKFQAFDDSFVKLEDFKGGTWKITVEIDHSPLHFIYTGRVRATDGPSSDLRVSLDDVDFAVGYWDAPLKVDGEDRQFALAEMVALWDDEPLQFSEGVFTLLSPYTQNKGATQKFAEGKKWTADAVKKTPAVRWGRVYEKQIDAAFDDIWNKNEMVEKTKAVEEEALAAAAAQAEEERLAKLAAEEEAKKEAAEKARLAEERKAKKKERSSRSRAKKIPEPEEVAEEAADEEESYSAATSSSRLVKNDNLRSSLVTSLTAVGAGMLIVAIVEQRNTGAAQFLYNQYVASNGLGLNPDGLEPFDYDPMAQAYDKVKRDHEMNRTITAVLAVLSLGASFVIYKF